jgi:hypothetical protein
MLDLALLSRVETWIKCLAVTCIDRLQVQLPAHVYSTPHTFTDVHTLPTNKYCINLHICVILRI